MKTTTRSNDPGKSGSPGMPIANADQARKWRDALPLGDASATARQLIQALTHLHGDQISAAQRYDILEVFRPLNADVVEVLHKTYVNAGLPLDDKAAQRASLVQQLLAQMAHGYKLVAANLASANPPQDYARDLILKSLYESLSHLGRLLVETYTVYAPEPPHTWQDLHRLYHFAEQRGLHVLPLNVPYADTPNPSIGQAYRRIVLLALANPYHLMQGETLVIYQDLDKWAGTCRISAMSGASTHRGQLYVDLASDAPPKYAPPKLDIPPPQDGRLLDISAIRAIVQKRMREISGSARANPTGQTTLAERKQIYMYKRLAEAWGVRSERLSARTPREQPIELTAGISACHHFFSDGRRFEPEDDELRIRRTLPGGGLGLDISLAPTEHQPWVHEDTASRLAKGIIKPRVSLFTSPDERDDKDVWVKVYSTSVQHSEEVNAAAPIFRVAVCQQIDDSQGGMSVRSAIGHGIQVSVGEIVGYKSAQEAGGQGWAIGAICWARTTTDNRLELGVRSLADDAAAVAVKGLKGVGKGTEYVRALLIPNLDIRHFPTTLIMPAAIFDIDSILMINTGKDLVHVRLTRLIEATNAYARFQFASVSPSEVERPTLNPNKSGRMLR